MAQYITIEELKREYPLIDYTPYSDVALNSMINTASHRIEDYIEYTFEATNYTDEITKAFINADNCLVIFPRTYPINSISSITLVRGFAEFDINLVSTNGNPSYTIPSSLDRIIIPVQSITLNAVSILDFGTLKTVDFFCKLNYNAGFAVIPPVVKQACALYVFSIMARNLNMMGAHGVSQGGMSIQYGSMPAATELVNEAEKILVTYRKVQGW